MALTDVRYIDLPQLIDGRGSLTFAESNTQLPFELRRVYYLYNVPVHESRGAHGHKKLQQVIVALHGSFDVTLDDGHSKKTFTLNHPAKGLYVPSMMWRDLDKFSEGAICLVLASEKYDEADYYRNYADFVGAAKAS